MFSRLDGTFSVKSAYLSASIPRPYQRIISDSVSAAQDLIGITK